MPIINNFLNRSFLSNFSGTELEAGYNSTNKLWEVIIKYNGDILRVSEELDVEVEILSENYAIVTLPIEKISLLYDYSEVEHIETPKILSLNLLQEITQSCISAVKSPNQFDLTGKGTAIAIVDSGIDYTHPDFINDDGTSRIVALWDQTAEGSPPKGFTHGAEYLREQINDALKSSDPFSIVPQRDEVGHGTAVAGIAAGNGRASAGINVGVASEADLIIVKLGEKGYPSFARTTELMRALKYVIDKSREMLLPVSVNISYGSNDGPHNGQSLFERYIDNMAEKWKCVITVSAGNEAAAGHHYRGQISSNENQDVTFFYSGEDRSFYVALWKNFTDDFTVELVLPNGGSTGEILPYELTRAYKVNNTYVYISYGQPQFYNSFQEIFFQINTSGQDNISGVFTIKIRAAEIVDGVYDIYLPTTEEVGTQTAFTFPEEDSTITIPSTAQRVITVGSYDSSRETVSEFSGRGFTINVVYTKPDLLAPGVNVLTTQVNGGYASYTGTSFSAPFVAGSAALMMQWGIVEGHDPFLYGERVKAYLKRGAKRRPVLRFPNNDWGYGALCLYKTMSLLRSLTIY